MDSLMKHSQLTRILLIMAKEQYFS